MAELLGIVAGGAGLVSLALQLVDGGQKLRDRYKNAKGLEGNILWLGQDLELIGQQLIQLESSAYIILQEQLGPIMLERCRSRSACVAARLDSLTQAMPVTISKRELIQATLRSGQWKSELEELQCLVTGLKQDISQLYIIEHHTLMQQTRKEVIIKDNECAPSAAVSSTQVAACTGYSNMDQQGITQRSARKCSCSCHKNCTISGVFWRLQYSPLLGMFRSCSNTSCTARRYRIDIHLALYRYGIPFQVTALLDLIVEPGRYSLQPSLEIETTVDFTAPQFEILRKLNTKEMEWVTAEKELRSIYRSNPRFVNQVNPSGQGFLEYAHGIIATPGIMFNLSFEILRSLYGLFMNEFHTNESCHSVGLMKTLGRLATANSDSRDLVVSLVSMGCDFRDTAPTAETWDLAPVAFIHSDYDAFLQALLKRNPDFADSPPLHYSVLHDSDKAFEILVKQISQPLEHHVNFLGQTPLHLAVRQPLRVLSLLNAGHEIDPRDKGGITPLVYAAAEDVHDSILILVGRGASLVTGNLGLTAAHYLGGRSDWDLLWKILDLAPTTELDVICQVLHEALRMFRKYEWYSTYESDGMQDGCLNFWTKVVTKLGSPNTIFDDGETLMSHARCPKDVNALIELGFGQFNYRDNYGMNCLFSMAYLTSPSLFRLDVLNGADIETQDNRGYSVLPAPARVQLMVVYQALIWEPIPDSGGSSFLNGLRFWKSEVWCQKPNLFAWLMFVKHISTSLAFVTPVAAARVMDVFAR
ncbi:hypothetical protein FPSE_11902 [Fusarium pseudograminearum CS3096]|uniref:Uncharacterized protein n=1 Tax=Fusarium pseudograminearum (strain CS3096) TaxID=1028729 RepID=K3V7U3_FUSPC|nr:hypothetical protein FPSE_11902 [Fusarium pseudograminearum CS3096]EKJ67893.1 hypothetical protein FPSE_11902 [Fusarium pseudograminearum CS3096]